MASNLGKYLLETTRIARLTARKSLNKKPHFVPLDMEAFSVPLAHILTPEKLLEFHQAVLDALAQSGFKTINLTRATRLPTEELKKLLPVVVEYKKRPIGVIFQNSAQARTQFFKPILNKTLAQFSQSGGFNIGHLASTSPLAKTPLQLKLEEVNYVLSLSNNTTKLNNYVAEKIISYYYSMPINKALALFEKNYAATLPENIYTNQKSFKAFIIKLLTRNNKLSTQKTTAEQQELSTLKVLAERFNQDLITKTHYGSTIVELSIVKTINPLLTKLGASIVIIQDRRENQLEYGNKIANSINRAMQQQIISNLLVSEFLTTTEVTSPVVNTLLNKPQKSTVSKKHEKLDVSLKEPSSTRGTVEKPGVSTKMLPLRTQRGQFQSIANLEAILRAFINEIVADNMSRPHLIYRTGRFSRSVEVVKLTRTRNDEVTAFLTYMKYPYQTFEPGFRQGHKGYDPRILIDKSVRQILQPLVKARLQTLVV